MHDLLEGSPSSSSFTGLVDRLGSDGAITAVSMPARKQPYTGLSVQSAPVLPELVEQLWTEQHIPISAAFAALDVNHHALTRDVAYFQTPDLGTPDSSALHPHHPRPLQR